MKSNKGVTLIELLVVVAIISALATASLPIYRRIVQNSKKSEAQVALSVLYTTESGFRSEFNTFGNNLPAIGFEQQGSTQLYSVGFSDAGGCGNQDPVPPLSQALGRNLQRRRPDYFGTVTTVYPGINGQCYESLVEDTGDRYIAMAMGNIAPGTEADNGADIWVINQNRALQNCRDGVNGGDPDNATGFCADFTYETGTDDAADTGDTTPAP